MITFGKSYIYDGKAYATLEEAQTAALRGLFSSLGDEENIGCTAGMILKYKAEIVSILTLTDRSHPKARGVKKPRKQATAPSKQEAKP